MAIRASRPRTIFLLLAASFLGFLAGLHVYDEEQVKNQSISERGGTLRARTVRSQVIFAAKDDCFGWNPRNNVTMDPPHCFRARQYRQVEAVRIKLDAQPWWFYEPIVDVNKKQLEVLQQCFLPDGHPDKRDCPPKPVVIIGWSWTFAAFQGATSGEAIWQLGVCETLRDLGYTHLVAGGQRQWIGVAQMMPDVYHSIWIDDNDMLSCIADPRCIAKEHYVPPAGTTDLSLNVPEEELGTIPLYHLHTLTYWGCKPREISPGVTDTLAIDADGLWSSHPLGLQWVLTPFAMPAGHVHLPYAIEKVTKPKDIVPASHRNNSVLILAKVSSYFHGTYAPPRDFYANLTRDTGLTFVSVAEVQEGNPLPSGVVSLGPQSRENFETLVGSVKALLGIGWPTISPSVYVALSRGTPSILPFFRDNVSLSFEGWDAFADLGQHGPAQKLRSPYVYSYMPGDYEMLLEQITQATSHPIGAYIPEDMKVESVTENIRRFLTRDLKGMFNAVLKVNGGRIPAIRAKMYERCRERGDCWSPFPPGTLPAEPARPVDWTLSVYDKGDYALTQEQMLLLVGELF